MARKAEALSPLAISKLRCTGLVFVGHIPGLALHISKTGARSWILRASVAGKRRDIGLGGFPEVSFAQAREIAAEKRNEIAKGIDPIAAKVSRQAALRAEQGSFITFREAAEKYILAHEKGWRNAKHVAQWKSTLSTYVYPLIGKMHVKDISLEHILSILEPLWSEKAETASRLRGRIEVILNWAKVRGFRSGDNPAQWRGNLDSILPSRHKIAKVVHHAAMPWHDCPAFIEALQKRHDTGAKLLQLIILTATRSGEARAARWEQFDLQHKIWTIPADQTKSGKEHRVPLSEAAISILSCLPEGKPDDIVFLSLRGGKFSDMALTMLLRRLDLKITVHGFRSTFRDWAGETTPFAREVIEHALAHQLKNKSEAAYARGDLFTKRRALMSSWADFCCRKKHFSVLQTSVAA